MWVQYSSMSERMWEETMRVLPCVAEVAEEFAELDSAGGIETGGGLVEEDNLGAGHEGACDAETLFHAA